MATVGIKWLTGHKTHRWRPTFL